VPSNNHRCRRADDGRHHHRRVATALRPRRKLSPQLTPQTAPAYRYQQPPAGQGAYPYSYYYPYYYPYRADGYLFYEAELGLGLSLGMGMAYRSFGRVWRMLNCGIPGAFFHPGFARFGFGHPGFAIRGSGASTLPMRAVVAVSAAAAVDSVRQECPAEPVQRTSRN
jgi:hypothetical protein